MKKFFSSKLFRLIWSAGLAALFYYVCPPCFSKTTLTWILSGLLIIVNIFPFFNNTKGVIHTLWFWKIQIFRVGVGGLFIFSGFIKSNDPLGFSYKLEEYFDVFVEAVKGGQSLESLGLFSRMSIHFFEFFHGHALILAILLCVSEMILGFMLLVGYKRNLTLWLLLAQIVFFTFLTFYSACYNKVTHCGCFGDFLKLKPWESFWKDIVLMISIAILFTGRDHINEIFTYMITNSLVVLALIASIVFPVYAYRNLPPFDFRPYAIGMDIKKNMETPPTYKPPVYETRFWYRNLQTNEIKEFDMKNYPWQDTLHWAHDSTLNILVHDAIDPPKIVDFSINDLDGNPITDSILNIKGYHFLLVCYDLNKTDDDETLHAKMNDLYKLAASEKIPFLALTASDAKMIDNYKHAHQALYDFANVDGIVLKTMIRSNPGLILMNGSTVVMNWHYHNFPTYSDVKQKYMK